MKVLIIGDTHIDDPYIDELECVFDEILKIQADVIIHGGDFYDKNRPSPRSLIFGTSMVKKMAECYKEVIILAGNGSHESLNGHNINSYMKYLSENISPVEMQYEREFDGKKCFIAHFMTDKSMKEYGSPDLTVSKLKKYDYVLLSHQHQPQELVKNKIYHIGSVFYKNFGEVEDKNKQVVLIDNGKLSFIPLKSPIPMVDIIDVKKLNKIDPKTKVRLIIKSFEDYKRNVNHLSKWKEKFHTFEYKLDFKQITEKKIEEVIKEKKEPESKSLKLLLNEELNKIEDEEVKGLLISQFEESK